MTALGIIEECRALGVEVLPLGENILIRPADRVPPDLKARLREHKPEILAALKSRPAEAELPPLGSRNERGEMVLTVADLPELERRLRLSGWKVTRRGDELICVSGRKAWIQ
jgi:hypothetical protein